MRVVLSYFLDVDADSLVGMIAKPMNRFAACGDPRAEKR
jgi:hypothetical protein